MQLKKSRIRAPYDALCRVVGNPAHKAKPGERVAWDVDVDGARAHIHAHPDDRPVGFGATSIFEAPNQVWHVEAKDDEQLAWVCVRIAERVIEAVAKQTGPRTLTADDKAAVNALLKKGVPLGEAMKRVQMQSDDSAARRLYTWPLADEPSALVHDAPPPAPASEDFDDAEEDAEDDADESGDDENEASAPKATPAAHAWKPGKPLKALGPPMPSDLPRGSVEASFEKLRAVLGEPEDRPVPFVSTRWRFVLDEKRAAGSQVLRWEDEPSDDPRDVDAVVFDRISRFDDPFASRTAARSTWTVTSSSSDHLARVLAWLEARLNAS